MYFQLLNLSPPKRTWGIKMNNNYDPRVPKRNDNGWVIGVVSAIAVVGVIMALSVCWLGYRIVDKSLQTEKTVANMSLALFLIFRMIFIEIIMTTTMAMTVIIRRPIPIRIRIRSIMRDWRMR